MGTISYEKRQAFLNDPTDKRHGTMRGYQLRCRCDRCKEAYGEYAKSKKQRDYERYKAKKLEAKPDTPKPKTPKSVKKDVCTIPFFLLHLMGKPNIDNVDGRCSWCGAPANNHHHIVRRSAGTLVKNGREVSKPTVLLCGDGNASGCHGKAHQHLLHFDFVEPEPSNKEPTAWYGAGHWVGQEFDEPISQFDAMQIQEGWRKL